MRTRENRKQKNRLARLMGKGLGSVIAIAVILILSSSVVKFCMGLFLTGDYIVTLPGGKSPVLYHTDIPDSDLQNMTNSADPNSTDRSARATLTVTGDIMLHMPIVRSGATGDGYNFDSIFSHVSSYISRADYAVANLETTLSGADNGNEYTGYPNFNSPDAISDSAKTAGFDMLLTGNNHCNDYGTFGLKRTLDILKNRGLDTLGTTGTAQDVKYLVKNVDGIKVGMVSYTYAEIGDNRDQPKVNSLQLDSNAAGLLNAFDYSKLDLFYSEMSTHIQNMKAEGAEAIVLFIHWGDEYVTTVNANQTAIAQKMCDLGVDVIAGSHPHVVQQMDLLTSTADPAHQTVCLYSMGNFLSNQRADNIALNTGHSEDGVLFSFTIARNSSGEVYIDSIALTYTWVLVRGSGDSRTYHILPLDDNVSDWAKVYELSEDQLADARASYNRTKEILAAGQSKVASALAEANANRPEEAPVAVG